jgi:hypothetical protein
VASSIAERPWDWLVDQRRQRLRVIHNPICIHVHLIFLYSIVSYSFFDFFRRLHFDIFIALLPTLASLFIDICFFVILIY